MDNMKNIALQIPSRVLRGEPRDPSRHLLFLSLFLEKTQMILYVEQ